MLLRMPKLYFLGKYLNAYGTLLIGLLDLSLIALLDIMTCEANSLGIKALEIFF